VSLHDEPQRPDPATPIATSHPTPFTLSTSRDLQRQRPGDSADMGGRRRSADATTDARCVCHLHSSVSVLSSGRACAGRELAEGRPNEQVLSLYTLSLGRPTKLIRPDTTRALDRQSAWRAVRRSGDGVVVPDKVCSSCLRGGWVVLRPATESSQDQPRCVTLIWDEAAPSPASSTGYRDARDRGRLLVQRGKGRTSPSIAASVVASGWAVRPAT